MLNTVLSVIALLLLLTTGTAQRVRLVGGPNPREGRLEVNYRGTWGTVCDDWFTDAAASVVCYMLGYGRVGWDIGNRYGAGSGAIWLDNVRCSGTETYVGGCQHNGWGNHNCVHGEDVSLSCNIVRLVGGPSPREGRLEVYYNGTWGTVCDGDFNNAAARVACYMLGFTGGQDIGDRYGAGNGTIWLDDVRCDGTETNITECEHRGWGSHDCGHYEDVSVSCDIPVRLVGGPSPREGRLEVYYNGTWGTVCDDDDDDDFNNAAARVVCYMLGYNDGQNVGNRYGAGSGTIWLDDVNCTGTEANIEECRHRGWGSHNCRHSDDVSVSCNTTVRLVGGPSLQEGRLEVYYNGTWGTVCGNGFTDTAARVVCYMIVYDDSGQYIDNSYGAGSGTIWLDDVECNGTETSIADCQHKDWGSYNCTHDEDVSVSCPTVRLVGGSSPREGRLEVYHDGRWGIVCYNNFTDTAARVVCYMLGYGQYGRFRGSGLYRSSLQITLDNVQCNGTETDIANCQHRGWGSHNCALYGAYENYYRYASVSCITVRLIRYAGREGREGRLEVYHNGRWGTVCRHNFNDAAARVVCNVLGYENLGRVVAGNRYGAGNGPIWLDDVQCNGTETILERCLHSGWGRHDCDHSEDVAVSCFSEVRLVGESGSRGRLEVYHNDTWGTVCDDGFTDAAAGVVCYSLGYGRSGQIIGNAYGAGHGTIWLDDVRCYGWESHITECPHNVWGRHNCSHSADVSISCIADSAEAVALVGGGNPRVGLLEVFHGRQWGTVCDDGFTDAAARVVCYSLGFGYVGRKLDINLYGVGDGLIWLNNINCTGTEQHIGECSHDDWGVHSCSHQQDVAVSCVSTSVTPVRLVGGSSSRGRLEVLHSKVWGTVCGDLFTSEAVSVVCKMLGFMTGTKIDNRNYTTSEGPIWLDYVQCNGTETDIAECSHKGWGVHNCQHREDVAVFCSRVAVRLNGGGDPREGRLEMFYNDTWRSVCGNRFNDAAARVVCYMLGFGYIGQPISNIYGYGDEPMWQNSVLCSGTEISVDECVGLNSSWSTGYCWSGAQAVSCLTDGAVALFGGASPREGRLEVHNNGTWGTVCDDRFTDAAARVVCYSLGFGYVGREMKIDIYGTGEGEIWLDNVQCEGTERHVSECSDSGWGVHDCEHHEDVAVSCVGNSSATSSKLTSSSSQMSTISSTTSTTSPTSGTSSPSLTVVSTTSPQSMTSSQSLLSFTASTSSSLSIFNPTTSLSHTRSTSSRTSLASSTSSVSSEGSSTTGTSSSSSVSSTTSATAPVSGTRPRSTTSKSSTASSAMSFQSGNVQYYIRVLSSVQYYIVILLSVQY